MLPVEYLIGEMYWWQEISKAKQSDPDQFWSREHMTDSCAEGLCIPRSLLHRSENNLKGENFAILSADLDLMEVKETFVKITDETIPIFDIARSGSDPRYLLLPFTEQWKKLNPAFSDSVYLQHSFLLAPRTTTKFWGAIKPLAPVMLELIHEGIHGPARKLVFTALIEESCMSLDTTVVFEYPNVWPESAMDWLIRPRKSGWPSPALVQEIFYSGCHLAPVGKGQRASEPVERVDYLANPGLVTSTRSQQGGEGTVMDEREWRISFSLAENKLAQSLSPVQRLIMVLLKIARKVYLSDHDVISTYLLKNLFFWECENRENDFWREDNSDQCLLSVLDRLVECLKKRQLPHYIIPESNLLMNEEPVKLDEAAETVLKVRENIFQKTFSVLTRLQSTMFQSREFFCDFNDSMVENKLIANELLYSLCQRYKDVIVDEHETNKENAKKSEQIALITDGSLSFLDIYDHFCSDVESVFSQPLSQGFLHRFFSSSFWSDENDDLAHLSNEMTKIKRAFGSLKVTQDSSMLANAYVGYVLQELFVFTREAVTLMKFSSIEGELKEVIDFFLTVNLKDRFQEETIMFALSTKFVPLFQKYKKDLFGHIKDLIVQLGNLAKLFFSNISQLRLRVHESLLARVYCKLWFADIGKNNEHNREAFIVFVREDVKSCPHLDERFIQLSLTFFDGMIMGRDSCQIVPDTTAMEQVKKIQQSIAHEAVKVCKTLYLLCVDLFNKDDGFCKDAI